MDILEFAGGFMLVSNCGRELQAMNGEATFFRADISAGGCCVRSAVLGGGRRALESPSNPRHRTPFNPSALASDASTDTPKSERASLKGMLDVRQSANHCCERAVYNSLIC
jgi:hypothetical protein